MTTCDFMCGSPTALANKDLEERIKNSVENSGSGFYVPSGAFWGGEDIRKMADRGTLKVIKETYGLAGSRFEALRAVGMK